MSILSEFCRLRPVGGFGLIMADPAWRYDLRSEKGEGKAPQSQYDCMSLGAIAALPVEALAGEDCILWLWAVNPMLPEALLVMGAWGFKFKTAGTWAKRTRKAGKDAFGTGYILRGSNEPFLIGTRGSPRIGSKSVRSTVATFHGLMDTDWPAANITIDAVAREHSRKPDEAFEAAEALAPDVRRLELFSRQSRPGWSTWGNEAGKFDERCEV